MGKEGSMKRGGLPEITNGTNNIENYRRSQNTEGREQGVKSIFTFGAKKTVGIIGKGGASLREAVESRKPIN